MPAKLCIGLSRKVGEANYGSRGASINLEVELDSMSLAEPALLRENVRKLYAMARRGVEEELSIEEPRIDPIPSDRAVTGNHANGHPHPDRGTLTASQQRAIFAIARRQNVDPTDLAVQRFHLDRIEDLSVRQASELIDLLKSRSNGVVR